VCAYHSGNPTVEMPTHGDFLSRGLSVKIHHYQTRFTFQVIDNRKHCAEGTIYFFYENPALKVNYAHIDPVPGLENTCAVSWIVRGVVDRPEDFFPAVKVGVNFFAVPDVISAGNNINAEAYQFLGDCRGQAEAPGGVLTVGDTEVYLFFPDKVRQKDTDYFSPRATKDIGDKENPH